jgi:deoxyribose-phosphate aldolase
MLSASGLAVGTVIGFPLGHDKTAQKVAQTRCAIADGAWEVDMVINIAHLLDRRTQAVQDDIAAVVAAADGKVVKVILECAYLSKDDIRRGCQAVLAAEADFVKTSTGFATGGATVEDVRLMAECTAGQVGVKASGGIGDLAAARAMLQAGATRLGTSKTAAILDELADETA